MRVLPREEVLCPVQQRAQVTGDEHVKVDAHKALAEHSSNGSAEHLQAPIAARPAAERGVRDLGVVGPQRHGFDVVQARRVVGHADEAVRVWVVAGNHRAHRLDLLWSEGASVVAARLPLEDDDGNHFARNSTTSASSGSAYIRNIWKLKEQRPGVPGTA